MALFSALIPSASADVVAIFETNTGRQVFPDARPLKVVVNESARLMAHPIENGASIIDHRIILPVSLDLNMILRPETFRETYLEIRRLFQESVNLTVQTKTATYPNVYLQEIPHEEDPAVFTTIGIVLSLVETLIATVQIQALPPTSVSNPVDQSTIDRGQQTSEMTQPSVGLQIARSIGAFFSSDGEPPASAETFGLTGTGAN